MSKPILCLDFDGVIHSYTSGWQGAGIVSDPPVPGALTFIAAAMDDFEVHIFSSRSNQNGGIEAMQQWLIFCIEKDGSSYPRELIEKVVLEKIKWPTYKQQAFVTIDDRAITFTGVLPSISDLKNFKPWNKKSEVSQ